MIIDNKEHTVELYNSFLTGKRKVVHNKKELINTIKYFLFISRAINFCFSFSVEYNIFHIN